MLFGQIVRYLFIGGFCSFAFLLSANVFYALYPVGWTATIASNCIGILCGYFLQMRITFKTRGQSKTFAKYLILSFLIFIYSQIITFLFKDFGITYLFISLFIALSVPFFSYPLQKFWVFGDRK